MVVSCVVAHCFSSSSCTSKGSSLKTFGSTIGGKLVECNDKGGGGDGVELTSDCVDCVAADEDTIGLHGCPMALAIFRDVGDGGAIAMTTSVSDSFEFSRSAATDKLHLLGDAVVLVSANGCIELFAKHRRFASDRQNLFFFGDGSISDSEISDDAYDASEIVSKSICVGEPRS